MSVSVEIDIIETAQWPQRDARDPLGVWGARGLATGDVSGGFVQGTLGLPADRRAGHVYTCYGLTATLTSVSGAVTALGVRLLTNWPNADVLAGVQGFATMKVVTLQRGEATHVPQFGPDDVVLEPAHRFILLFDPRTSQTTRIDLVEMWMNVNTDGETYSFEGYGYYWDREVMNAPGGPRHPGSS